MKVRCKIKSPFGNKGDILNVCHEGFVYFEGKAATAELFPDLFEPIEEEKLQPERTDPISECQKMLIEKFGVFQTRHNPEVKTLRDEFAIAAFPAVWASSDGHASVTRDDIVGECYQIADAMMKAREVKRD